MDGPAVCVSQQWLEPIDFVLEQLQRQFSEWHSFDADRRFNWHLFCSDGVDLGDKEKQVEPRQRLVLKFIN